MVLISISSVVFPASLSELTPDRPGEWLEGYAKNMSVLYP